ncbi:MAG: rod shape-determining protein MreC [Candidatus Binatia bacterium]
MLSSFLCVLFSLYILTAASRGYLKADPIGPLLLGLMRPLQIGVQATVATLKELQHRYAILRGLASENEGLKRRILELEAERNRLLEAEATNRRLRELLEFRSQLPSGSITAAVIGNSASTWSRSLILDKGSADGVFKGMAVVSPVGVVGQIVAVTSRSAKALLLTDPNSGVDVIVQRSRARGIVSGSLDNEPNMKYVKRSKDIQEGDRLITSGLDGVFPKGLLVGTVAKVRKKSFGLFQYVGVALAVKPSQIEEVLVVSAEAAQLED